MKDSSTFTNKYIYRQGSRSMEKMIPLKKMSLTLMDEKLYLLNSDIEELYRKYAEENNIHERKEKSERSIVNRIDFLIDEERKIRNQIENNVIHNDLVIKNRSLKMLKAPEIEANIETLKSIRYNTIDKTGEKLPHKGKHRFNKSEKIDNKIKHINNLNNIEIKCQRKNIINQINFYNKQSNSKDKKRENENFKQNVTNNVCIIINDREQKESEENVNDNINFENISFSKLNIVNNKLFKKNKNNNKVNNYININGSSHNKNANKNTKNNEINNKNKYNYNVHKEKKMNKNNKYLNSDEKENENLIKINNEINFIKMRLALKLKEENKELIMQNNKSQKDAVTQTDQIDVNSSEIIGKKDIKNNNKNISNYNSFQIKSLQKNVKAPFLKHKMNIENKDKTNQSLRSILYSKQKNLKNLEKEIDIKKKNLKQKKISDDLKKNYNQKINLKTDNKNQKFIKKFDKRCFSKPDNNIKIKNKVLKSFNHENIINNLNNDKTNIKNSSKKRINSNSKKPIKNDLITLSIDSDENILFEINKSKIINNKNNVSNTARVKYSIFDKKNKVKKKKKNIRIRYQHNDYEKIYYEYDSTPNLLNNINLTFNQSIEKKRELLGLPQEMKEKIKLKNIKKEILINDKINEENNNDEESLNQNKIKVKNTLKNKIMATNKKEEKTWNKYNITNNSTRAMYNKKYSKRTINNINYKKDDTNDNNHNIYKTNKKKDFDSNYFSNCNKNKVNNPEIISQLFNSTFNNYTRFSSTSKDKNNNIMTSNGSLTSMYSAQTNKTNITNKTNNTLIKYKISDQSDNKSKNMTNSKEKNKYKKYSKNNINKENQNLKGEISKNVIRNLNDEMKDMDNHNLYEKEIKVKRQLAAIRRINQIKETYKKKGPQIYQISKRHLNRFENKNDNINNNSNKKGNKYQFQSLRRLSEIKKGRRTSFSKQNANVKNKSKSNRSLIKISKDFKSFH